MSKKRRTKQQKIIARLKRQLAQNDNRKDKESFVFKTEQKEKKIKPFPTEINKKNSASSAKNFFSYSPKLIKKDLIKTAILSLIFLGIIFLIPKFFHL